MTGVAHHDRSRPVDREPHPRPSAGRGSPEGSGNLSLAIGAGETLCVVGESGSGKSLTAHAVMGLLPRGVRPVSGSIRLAGQNLLGLGERAMRNVRGRAAGMIFQEPMTSLNPVMRVADQIAETFEAHGVLDRAGRRRRGIELLAEVGLPDPERSAKAFPHELSAASASG
jgi:peptide/nickel transport system ATP-binding protein